MGGQSAKPCCGCKAGRDGSDAPGAEPPVQVTDDDDPLRAPPEVSIEAPGGPPGGPAAAGRAADCDADPAEDPGAQERSCDEHPTAAEAAAPRKPDSLAEPGPPPPAQEAPSLPLTRPERDAVMRSWMKVEDLGVEAVGLLLFQKIFELAPETLQLFSFRNEPGVLRSPKLKAHGTKVVNFVGVAVAMLGDLEALVPILQEMGLKHIGFGIRPQANAAYAGHYDVVGRALIETLRAGLGEVFDPELEVAWKKVYRIASATMMAATAEMAAKVAAGAAGGRRPKGGGQAAPKRAKSWGMINSLGLLRRRRT